MGDSQGLHEYLSGIRTIGEAFDVYRQHVMPKSAHESQVIETRRAFFAAADWFYRRLLAATDDEEDAMALMLEVEVETKQHIADVLAGKA